ncbi:hypothetical protein SDC9_108875 [bioreactor metagenome]|uniref:EamA domain-containing protein n=1 Tax=bioreactor metagenome TaxID=1076179 RepID=A0A645B970_9ZZZZ
MLAALPVWLAPILLSALGLGFYDLCKKHAVRDNPIMPVLFLATLSGSLFFVLGTAVSGGIGGMLDCTPLDLLLILAKSLLVAASWSCVYYAMRELPISIVAPVRATAPLWTFIGSLFLFHEIPTAWQGVAMLVIFTGYYLFSVIGKQEGISFLRHRGAHMVLLGTLLGSLSALYDKYLLGTLGMPRVLMQFHFSVDLVVILGLAWLIRVFVRKSSRTFTWRWSIPVTGILLIVADWLYFYALSLPDTQISILSLLRRCSCVVTFVIGSFYFRDKNIKVKAAALAAILAGVVLLAVAK